MSHDDEEESTECPDCSGPLTDGRCLDCEEGIACEGCGQRGDPLNDNMMCPGCEPVPEECSECGEEAVLNEAGLCPFCVERENEGYGCEICGDGAVDLVDGICDACAAEAEERGSDGSVQRRDEAPAWLRRVVLVDRKPKIEEAVQRAVGKGAKVDWEKRFGCGHYGCAWAVKERGRKEPRYVVKITRDPTEGPMQASIARRQKNGDYGFADGFAIVRGVYRIGDDVQHMGKMWPVYAVVREEVKPVNGFGVSIADAYPPINGSQLHSINEALNTYKERAAEWYAERARKKPSQVRLDNLEAKMSEAIRRISDRAPPLGEIMGILQGEGTPLRDVHSQNIGIRHHPGVADPDDPKAGLGYIVIFDPGHTPYAREKDEASIARMNPGEFRYELPGEHLSARANPEEAERAFHAAFGVPHEALLEPVWPKERAKYRRKITSPTGLASYLASAGDIPQEQFMVALLDQRGMLMGVVVVSKGTINEAAVHPREVFAAAIAARAVGIIGVHNHPSGDTAPSDADIALTKQLADVGAIVGIPLLDHIVLGRGGEHVSLAERGLMPKATRRFQNNPATNELPGVTYAFEKWVASKLTERDREWLRAALNKMLPPKTSPFTAGFESNKLPDAKFFVFPRWEFYSGPEQHVRMAYLVTGGTAAYVATAKIPRGWSKPSTQRNAGLDAFDFADAFGQEAQPAAVAGGFHLDQLRRGDVVRVGKTRWLVFNNKHGAWVTKHGSKGKKMYQIRRAAGGGYEVLEMTGGGDLVGAPLAAGDAEVVGREGGA